MSVLNEALRFLGPPENAGPEDQLATHRPQMEQRELADAMRLLTLRHADRLPPKTLEQIIEATAAGHWEVTVGQIISTLSARGEKITAAEQHELHVVTAALNMTCEHIEAMAQQFSDQEHRPR